MFPVAAVPIEVKAVTSRVAEHAVEDDRDADGLGLGTQLGKVLLGAEQRVNLSVICGVVAVVGVCLKDGIQVQAGDAQPLKVRQILGDAGKVAAKIVGVGDLAPFVGQIDREVAPIAAQDTVGGNTLFGGSGVAEAVGENLVEDAVAQGGRAVHIGGVDG